MTLCWHACRALTRPLGQTVVHGLHVVAGTGQADHDGVAVREADRLTHPDRGKSAQLEVEGPLDILHLEADVIKHARSLASG